MGRKKAEAPEANATAAATTLEDQIAELTKGINIGPVKSIRIRVTTFEEMLGTSPSEEDIYRNYIASKSPDKKTIEDEVAAIGAAEVEEKGTTIFSRDEDGNPFLYDYQIKGYMKDVAGMLTKVVDKDEASEDPDTGEKTKAKKKKNPNETSKLTSYKKKIDGLIFVSPRKIPITYDGNISTCQRPLRAQTAQGERIALASSEAIPAGAQLEFTVDIFSTELIKPVIEFFEYGKWRGLGQWRNSGKGRFNYEILEVK